MVKTNDGIPKTKREYIERPIKGRRFFGDDLLAEENPASYEKIANILSGIKDIESDVKFDIAYAWNECWTYPSDANVEIFMNCLKKLKEADLNIVVKCTLSALNSRRKEYIAGFNNDLLDAAFKGNLDMVRLLLAKGADVNYKDKLGKTPLMLASINGSAELISTLLVAGAHVNTKDNFEKTALMYSATNENIEIYNLLLKAGADHSLISKKGKTSQRYAHEYWYFHDSLESRLLAIDAAEQSAIAERSAIAGAGTFVAASAGAGVDLRPVASDSVAHPKEEDLTPAVEVNEDIARELISSKKGKSMGCCNVM